MVKKVNEWLAGNSIRKFDGGDYVWIVNYAFFLIIFTLALVKALQTEKYNKTGVGLFLSASPPSTNSGHEECLTLRLTSVAYAANARACLHKSHHGLDFIEINWNKIPTFHTNIQTT